MLTDLHTHNPLATDAIIAVGPDAAMLSDRFYSIAIHPWDVTSSSSIESVRRQAAEPQIVAIGETGLDRLRGASLAEQERLLRDHIRLSEQLRKPLIIHSVRTHEELLRLHRELHPSQPWIIHGFRDKPAAAERLLNSGIYLSLGSRFNPATARIIPPDRLLIETDDDPSATTASVAASVAAARSVTPQEIISLASANLNRLIFQKI